MGCPGFAPRQAGCCRPAPGRQGECSHRVPPAAKAGCHPGTNAKAKPVCPFILQTGWEEQGSRWCTLL